MEEKRKGKRISGENIKIYKIQENAVIQERDEHLLLSPESIDISISGLSVVTDKELVNGALLDIVLSLLPSKIPMHIKGKIVHVTPIDDSILFNVGIEFLEFDDPKKHKLLQDYIESK